MELLEQLESQVTVLLDALGQTRAENARISAEAAALAEEKTSLEEENRRLREELENGETLRNEARNRIDALLHKIQEHERTE